MLCFSGSNKKFSCQQVLCRKYEYKYLQVALLSQRGRAMLRVIEYFAKSLKFTQGHSKWRRSVDHIRLSIGRPL